MSLKKYAKGTCRRAIFVWNPLIFPFGGDGALSIADLRLMANSLGILGYPDPSVRLACCGGGG